MSKISKHDSHQQFNKNNNVKWGDALDNADETVLPTSAPLTSDGIIIKEDKIIMSESYFNENVEEVDIPEDEIPEDDFPEVLEVVSDAEFVEIEVAPVVEKKKPVGFQKKTK